MLLHEVTQVIDIIDLVAIRQLEATTRPRGGEQEAKAGRTLKGLLPSLISGEHEEQPSFAGAKSGPNRASRRGSSIAMMPRSNSFSGEGALPTLSPRRQMRSLNIQTPDSPVRGYMSVQQDSILDIDSPRKVRPGRSMFSNMSTTKMAGFFVLLVLPLALVFMHFLRSNPAPMYVCGAGLKDLNGEYDFGGVSEGASFYGRATSHGNDHYVSALFFNM